MRDRPLPQLTIQQLDYLVAVDDHDTWAEAAASLGVTPSALSQGLAELERRLGIELFERVGRRRVLAPSNDAALDYARSVIGLTGELGRWISAVKLGSTGAIRVGMIDIAAIHYYAKVLSEFRSSGEELELVLRVAPSRDLLRSVQRDEIDLAIAIRPSVMPPGLDWIDLFDEELSVYGPDRPSTIPPPGEWGPWVLFPGSSHTRVVIEQAIRSAGGRFEIAAESNQPDVLRQMVRLGLGWTVLPAVQAGEGLAQVLDRPLVSRQLVLVTRAGRLPNPLLVRFIEAILQTRIRPSAKLDATDQLNEPRPPAS